MDWFVPNELAAGTELRREVREYLRRHAVEGSDIDGAVLAFSELLTNAVEHTTHSVWVTLDWPSKRPVVTIHDLGSGFELDAAPTSVEASSERGRGLLIASHLTSELSVAAKQAGGTRVTAILNVERSESADYDHPPDNRRRLPEIEEAEDGLFARETFLRALVVELADGVEFEQGPAVAESAIAKVGSVVGGQMEQALRQHRETDVAFSSDEIASFYVELKAAIGGDFYVISVDDERIVMGNRRCPFGSVVQHAPSLCRMTSSVFGGIAARNLQREVAVHLEERIAIGDPECRVTVWLDKPPPEVEVFVHRYRHQGGD